MPTQHFRTASIPAESARQIRLWPAGAEQTAQRIHVWIDNVERLVWQASRLTSRSTGYATRYTTSYHTGVTTSHDTSRSTSKSTDLTT